MVVGRFYSDLLEQMMTQVAPAHINYCKSTSLGLIRHGFGSVKESRIQKSFQIDHETRELRYNRECAKLSSCKLTGHDLRCSKANSSTETLFNMAIQHFEMDENNQTILCQC